MNQSRFRPIKHLKMTVWTSVLWKINIQLAKKWSDIVVEWPFISCYFLKSKTSGLKKKYIYNLANLILILWGKSGVIKFEFENNSFYCVRPTVYMVQNSNLDCYLFFTQSNKHSYNDQCLVNHTQSMIRNWSPQYL